MSRRDSLARHNVPIEEATTPSIEALKAYTEGIAAARRRPRDRSDPVLRARHRARPAVRAGLYDAVEPLRRTRRDRAAAKSYARLAYENRERVSERERLFITYQYHDRFTGDQTEDAQETLEVWKRTYPRDYRPANALAVLLNRLGDYPSAVAEAEEAISRNPAHAFPQSNLAYALRGAGRFDRAKTSAAQAVARNLEHRCRCAGCSISSPRCRAIRQTARAQLEWAATSSLGFDLTGARAQIAAFRGRMAEARQLYGETIAARGRARASRRSGRAMPRRRR